MNKKYGFSALFILLIVSAAGLIPQTAQTVKGEAADAGNIAWMLTATGLVLLMTPGLSYFYGGMVSARNIISTMFQSFIAMGVVSILWVVVGFSLAFGESFGGIIGNPFTFFMFKGVGLDTHPVLSPTIPFMLFALFQLKFAIITPALITGSFAERVRFKSYLIFMILFSLFIYSPLAHMTWHPDGFLRKLGVLDFAGGTVVHMSAGFAALAGALLLGRRLKHGSNHKHTPANVPYVILGTGLIWFGWFGFNAGSALEASGTAVLAFATTNTASAAAALAWIFFDMINGRKASAMGACIGAVVGLVAITPSAGFVTVGQSIFIGTVASIISNLAVTWKSRSAIDDTLDVFPCHGLGGIVGMVMTGIFASGSGLIYGKTDTFMAHIIGLVLVSVFTFGGSYALYRLTNFFSPLRVSEDDEMEGLDISQHGESVNMNAEVEIYENDQADEGSAGEIQGMS
ncbi:MAG: ammonium transporter [Ignavibacteriaceae bacterium]|nr:ammonium transporter [Ignavibacteriaceae bacterium]